jgi:hypothetical protein
MQKFIVKKCNKKQKCTPKELVSASLNFRLAANFFLHVWHIVAFFGRKLTFKNAIKT